MDTNFVNPSMSAANGQNKSFEEKINEIGVGIDYSKSKLDDIIKGQDEMIKRIKELQEGLLKTVGSAGIISEPVVETSSVEEKVEPEAPVAEESVPDVAENETGIEVPVIPEIGNIEIPSVDIPTEQAAEDTPIAPEAPAPEVGEPVAEIPQIEEPQSNEVENNEINNNAVQNDGFLAIGDLLNSVENKEAPTVENEVPNEVPSFEEPTVEDAPIVPEAPVMETPAMPVAETPAPMQAPEVPTMETPAMPVAETPAPMQAPEVPVMETPAMPVAETPAPAPVAQDNVEKININITDAQTTNGKQRSTVVSEAAQNNLLGKTNVNTLSLAA